MAMAARRSYPYTQEEKDILKEVIATEAKIIENKRTDAFSSKEKKEAWMRVAYTFNSYVNVTHRQPEQLKKAWENMKSLRKKQASTLAQHRMATGGGPSVPDLPDDPLMDMVAPYLHHTVGYEFDSDAVALGRPASMAKHICTRLWIKRLWSILCLYLCYCDRR